MTGVSEPMSDARPVWTAAVVGWRIEFISRRRAVILETAEANLETAAVISTAGASIVVAAAVVLASTPASCMCDGSVSMAVELHVLSGPRLLESFRLSPGTHLLGVSDTADLLLSARDVTKDICRVELGSDGKVTLRAVDETAIRPCSGTSALQVTLDNADFAEVAGLRRSEPLRLAAILLFP